MRLIDADLLKKNCKICGSFENNFQCVSLDTLGRVIDKQPTAYNIDKVVEELESLVKVTYFDTNGDTHLRYSMETILKAIEIVKTGGENDNK